VLEVIREAENGRELAPFLVVEERVASAAVQRPVIETDVGETTRLIGANRRVSGDVRHIVVSATAPSKPGVRIEIGTAGLFVALVSRHDVAARSRQSGVDGHVHSLDSPTEARGR